MSTAEDISEHELGTWLVPDLKCVGPRSQSSLAQVLRVGSSAWPEERAAAEMALSVLTGRLCPLSC